MGPSESLFEETQFKGASTGPFPDGPPWPQPQSSRPGSVGPSPVWHGVLSRSCSVMPQRDCHGALLLTDARRLRELPPNWSHLPQIVTTPVQGPTAHQGYFSSLLTGLPDPSLFSFICQVTPSSAPHPPMAPTYQANKASQTCLTPSCLPDYMTKSPYHPDPICPLKTRCAY